MESALQVCELRELGFLAYWSLQFLHSQVLAWQSSVPFLPNPLSHKAYSLDSVCTESVSTPKIFPSY